MAMIIMATNGSDITRDGAATIAAAGYRGSRLRCWDSLISSDFARKVLETYSTRIVLTGVALLTTVIVARLLGPDGRGYYAIATTIGALGVQFGNIGLHASNVYFSARDPRCVPSLTANSLVVSFGFGGILALLLAVLFRLMPALVSLHGLLLTLALVSIPFGLAYLLLQDLLLGVHDVRGYNLLEMINKLLPLLLITAIFSLHRVSVSSLFGATVVGVVASCIGTLYRLRPHLTIVPRPSLTLFRSTMNFAVKAYLTAFFSFLVLRVDLFLVQHIQGPEQAGYYSIAASMADVVAVLAAIIGTLLFPRLSALSDISHKLRLTYQTAWATALLLLPMLVVASALASWAVRLLFGQAFLPAAHAFVLLMPGMLFLGIQSVAVQFLNSIGFPTSVVAIWAASTVLNIAVNLWAIPRYGIAGASVVSSVSYFLAFLSVMLIIRSVGRRYLIHSIS
jgi:O-antigen/teichoic acid export membrane protein